MKSEDLTKYINLFFNSTILSKSQEDLFKQENEIHERDCVLIWSKLKMKERNRLLLFVSLEPEKRKLELERLLALSGLLLEFYRNVETINFIQKSILNLELEEKEFLKEFNKYKENVSQVFFFPETREEIIEKERLVMESCKKHALVLNKLNLEIDEKKKEFYYTKIKNPENARRELERSFYLVLDQYALQEDMAKPERSEACLEFINSILSFKFESIKIMKFAALCSCFYIETLENEQLKKLKEEEDSRLMWLIRNKDRDIIKNSHIIGTDRRLADKFVKEFAQKMEIIFRVRLERIRSKIIVLTDYVSELADVAAYILEKLADLENDEI